MLVELVQKVFRIDEGTICTHVKKITKNLIKKNENIGKKPILLEKIF